MSGFHNNRVVQQMVKDIINKLGISSFLETGTHLAATTRYVASNHINLPIFTCEIDPTSFAKSSKKLKNYPNITISQESSEKFIDRLIKEKILGEFPMFFLDAHWYDYWPLPDEVANIGALEKFAILIDDFKVPGQPQFENDNGGGGTIGKHRSEPDSRPCSMELIGEYLPSDCEVGYPNYNKQEAYGKSNAPHLRGHAFVIRGGDKNIMNEIKENKLFDWGGVR